MALWLVRTGRHGEFEQRFLQDNRIYLTWDGLKHDLSKLRGTAAVHEILRETYPNKTKGHLIQNTGQVWAFVGKMKPRDWIVVPSKSKPAINIAEIVGPYVFDGTIENPFYHYRDIKWIAKDIPRPAFDQDLLYSFGAFTTVCQIAHNDAEKRVRAMASVGWKSVLKPAQIEGETEAELAGEVDLEQLARDQIAKLVIQKFKGHGLARLVDAILKAQGYTTYFSPEGPDKGIDILAAL